MRMRKLLLATLLAAGTLVLMPAAASAPNHSHPFAWAQLVFYHRGTDHPLSLPVPADL